MVLLHYISLKNHKQNNSAYPTDTWELSESVSDTLKAYRSVSDTLLLARYAFESVSDTLSKADRIRFLPPDTLLLTPPFTTSPKHNPNQQKTGGVSILSPQDIDLDLGRKLADLPPLPRLS